MTKKLTLLLTLGIVLITAFVLGIRQLGLAKTIGTYISSSFESSAPSATNQTGKNSGTNLAQGQVLGLTDDFYRSLEQINFNLPSFFNDYVNIGGNLTVGGNTILEKDATVSGSLAVDQDLTVRGKRINFGTATVTGGNLITALTAGSGISVTTGTTPSIANTGVLSLQGKAGALKLEEGDNISIDGLKISAKDTGKDLNIFKTFSVSGQSDISASGNADKFTFAAGTGITLSTDATNKTLTINGTTMDASGWNTSTGNVYLTTSSDNVGIGTSTPTSKLQVIGAADISSNVSIGGNIILNGDSIADLTGNGLTVNSNALTVNIPTSGTTSNTVSNSGLEVTSAGVSMLRGCGNGELLKWNTSTSMWGCSTDDGGTTGIINVKENDVLVTSTASTVDYLGSDFNVVESPSGEVNISIDYPNSNITRKNQAETVTGAWAFSNGVSISSGLNNNGGGITNTGTIAGATGITSSGTITLSGLGTGIVHANSSGVLSSTALNLAGGSAEVINSLPATNGGTGLATYTTGDIIYASAANTLSKLAIGSSGYVLSVSGGVPVWSPVSSLCATCIVNNPGATQTITPTVGTATGLVIAQASSGSVDVFSVTNNAGSIKYLQVNSAGNVSFSGNATVNGNLAVTGTSQFTGNLTGVSSPTLSGFGTINGATLTGGSLSGGTFSGGSVSGGSLTGGTYTDSGFTVAGNYTGIINDTGNFNISDGTNPIFTVTDVGTKGNLSNIGSIAAGGTITGLTGITSSGTITLSGFTTNGGVLYTNGSGVVAQTGAGTTTTVLHGGTTPSYSAISLSTDVTGTLPTGNGGTGLTTFTTGDIIYASGANTLAKRGIGSSGQVLTVSGGVPTWAAVTGGGGLCADCLVNDPGSTQSIVPTVATATGLSIAQATSGSVDVFNVTDSAGTTKFLQINSSGNIVASSLSGTGNRVLYGSSTGQVSALADGGTNQVLTTNGSGTLSWSSIAGAGGVTGSGSNGRVTFWSGTSAISSNANFFWDDTNSRLGLGDTTPAAALTVGSGDLFQVNSSGAIAAATGITSSGTITFSGLASGTTSNGVCLNASNQLITCTYGGGTMSSFTAAGDTGLSQTISNGSTLSVIGGTNGIDTVASATGNITLNLDTTEIGTTTFGSGSATTWTFDASAGTDTTIAFGNNTQTFTTGTATFTGNVGVNGGDLTTSATTATLFNTNATTLSLGGAATIALNLGTGNSAYTAINLGTGTGGNTINIATNNTNADTVNIGSALDTLTLAGTTGITGATTINGSGSANTNIGTGTSTGTITIGRTTGTDLALNDANWNITGAGAANFASIGAATPGTGAFTTLSSTGATTLGNNTSTVAIDTTSWDVSSAGAISGLTGITSSGTITFSGLTTGTTSNGVCLNASNQLITCSYGGGTMSSFTAAGDSGVSQTISNGNTLSVLGGTNGIDTVASATGNITLNLDTTEVGTTTFGSGSGITWTFDASAGTDTTIAFGNNTQTFTTGTATFTGNVGVNGGDLTTSATTATLFNTSATTLSLGGAATTALNLGTGASAYTAINIGTGAGGNGINIGTNNTVADTIGIGSALDTLTLAGTTGITGATTINGSGSANTNIGTGTSTGTITIGRTTGTDLALNDANWNITGAGAANFASIGAATPGTGAFTTLSSTGATTLGNNSSTVAIDTTSWDVSSAGAFSGLTGLSSSGTITFSGITTGTTSSGVCVNASNQLITCTYGGGTGSMSSFTAAADSGVSQTISNASTLSVLGGTNGIDTVASATGNITLNLDTTEIGTTTFGSGSATTWTFDASAGTDTSIAFGNDTQTFTTGTATFSGNITGQGTTGMTLSGAGAGVTISGTGNHTISTTNAGSNLTIGTTTTGALSLDSGTTGTVSLGNGNNAKTVNIGSGTAGNTINIAGTGATGADTVNIGTGGTGADTINIGSNASTTALNLTSGTGAQSFTSSNATGTTTAASFAFNTNSLTTGTGLNLASSSLTSGTLASFNSTSTAVTSGGLVALDWSPGSSTTGTGDLLSINIGSNGTLGNLFNVKDSGSSIFSVSETAVTSNLPTNFTSPGDVSMAYDLQFTNPTASYIKSLSALTLEAGESFNSSDLTLRTFNSGQLVLDTPGGVTIQNAALNIANSSGTNVFTVNSSGAVTAATGITSSGTITFSSIASGTASNGVCINASNQLITCSYGGGTMSSFTAAGDTGSSQTISNGSTLTVAGGTNGIDTVASATGNITLNLDTTEIGTTTFGSGSGTTWTFDASAGTDTTIAFGNNTQTFTTGTATFTGNVGVNGGDLTTTSTTATLFNTNATTLSLGGAATTALNLGTGASAYTAINIGTGAGGNGINIGTNNTVADTIGIGSALDTITIAGTTGITGATTINGSGSLATNIGTGTSTGTITIGRTTGTDLALNDANWNITGAGAANFASIGAATPGTGAFTTLSSTGATTLGNNTSTVAIDTTSWDVSSAGAFSGLTGLSSSGTITFSGITTGTTSSGVCVNASNQLITCTYGGGTMSSFTAAADSGVSQTISNGNTLSVLGGTNGIDTVASATGNVTLNLDTTEIGTTTFGSGSGTTWTFDASAGTDTSIAFGNDTQTFTTGTATFSGNIVGQGTTGATLSGAGAGVTLSGTGNHTISTTNAGSNLTVGTTTTGALTLDSGTTGAVNLGTGSNAKTVTVGNTTGATALTLNSGTGAQSFNSSVASGTGSSSAFAFNANALTSGTGLNLASSSLTSGTLASFNSTSTAVTSGGLLALDWSPGSATTGTGDLLSLNIGANGTLGNLLNIKDSGSSVFSVSETAITANLPASFNAPGDVSMAYDLAFTNQTASTIKSNAPLTIEAGESFESNNLTLKTYNSGNLVLDIGSSAIVTPSGNLTLQPGGSGTTAAVQIGAGGSGSTTPDYLALDVKSTTGDPSGGAEGYMYYNTFDNKFRCYQGSAWTDCIGSGGSGTMSSFTAAADSGSSQTISDASTLSILGGTNGIDTVASATGNVTLNLDTTEIGTNTFGSGSGITWTFDASAGTDTTIAFGNNTQTFTTGTATFSGNVGVNGGDLTTSAATATLFNTNATTLSLGGAATTALNLGTGNSAYTAINIGTGTGGNVLNLATNNTTADTVNIGSALDTLALTGTTSVLGATTINGSGSLATNIGTGTSTGTITIGRTTGTDLALNDANWNISGAGAANFASIGAATPGTGAFTTLSSTGATTLGNNTSTVAIDTTSWDVSSAGAFTGLTGLSSSGTITFSGITTGVTSSGVCVNASNQLITCTYGGGTMSSFTAAADTGSSQTISNASTLSVLGGTNGIDTVASATGNITLNLDTTEIGTTTFGSGSATTWTFDASAGTDTTIAFGNNTQTFTTGTATFSGDVTAQGTTGLTLSGAAAGVTVSGTGNHTISTTNAGSNLTIGTTTTGALSLDSGTTGTVSLGNGNNAKTVNIGSGTAGNTINIAGTGATGADTVNIGTGGTGADTINIGSNASTTALNLTSGTGAQSFTSSVVSGTGTTSAFAFNANALTTGTGLNLVSSSITSGTLASFNSTSTALTSGGLMALDWSPGSSTTGTGDLLSLNIGSNGNIGNIFNVKDSGSSVFSVSESAITANLPTSFTAAGDVSFANNIALTNQTASYLRSNAPLYLEAGETFESNDLTLRTYNSGQLVIDTPGGTNINGVSYTWPSAQAASTGYVLTNNGSGTLSWAASSGGMTSFTAAADTGASQTISNASTLSVLGGTNGIDTVASATGNVTLNLDTTEIGTTTFGSGSALTWTFDASAGTDTTIAFGNNTQTFTTGTATFSGDVTAQGTTGLTLSGAAAGVTISGTGNHTISTTNAGSNLTIGTTTTGALSLDSGTTGTVSLGNGNNAKTVNIASGTAGNTLNLATGTGADAINIGTGATSADTIIVGNTGVATTFTFNSGASTTNPFALNLNSVTTSQGLNLAANALTTGTAMQVSSTSTALASIGTGALGYFNWSPASTTTATGDLFRINIGSNGNVGNLFNVTDNGTSVFSVAENQITSAVPQQFTAAGDVGIAYDLAFTNQTASFIKTNAPLTLDVGESFESNDLTLQTYNSGSIVLDTGATGSIDLLNAVNFGSQQTLSVNDTTPDVSGASSFKTANTSATTITTFDAGTTGTLRAGQIVFLEIKDANTDFDCTSSGLDCGTTDLTRPVSGDFLTWFYNGTQWKLVSMMLNTVNNNDATGEGFDLAEWYAASETLQPGDVVSVDKDAPTDAYIKKSSSARDSRAIGIVSTTPGMTLGEPANKTAYQIALAGRVPVKVSTENGPIEKGDYLTTSNTPGVATKATTAGPTIGKALGSYSGIGVGNVMVFVNVSWYDPDAFLASLSGTTITPDTNSTDKFSLTNSGGNLVSRIGLFSNASVANLSTGFIDAKKISLDGTNIMDLIANKTQPATQASATFTQEDLNSILTSAYHLETSADALSITKKVIAYANVNVQGDLQVMGQTFIKGKATFEDETMFNKLVTFVSNTIFKGNVSFEDHVAFNKDTAGIAIIEKNSDTVTVNFDKEYEAVPLVSATMVHEGEATSSAFLKTFYVTEKTTKGFKIKLDTAQTEDVSFNWIAIAVNDPKISKSSDATPAPSVDPVVQEGVDKLMKEATKSATTQTATQSAQANNVVSP